MENAAKRGHSEDFNGRRKGADTYKFKDILLKITAPNGLSHHERDLLTEAFDHMRRRGQCVFVSIEAGRSPEAEKMVRALARRVKSDIALRQRRAGMRRVHSVSVFEALGRDKQPKFGAHIVALMPDGASSDQLIASLNGSKAYGQHVLAKPVVGWGGLTGYLLKEATPQAQYRKGFRRIKGSIPLGELGGDRVVLSKDLKDTLLRNRQDRVLPAHLRQAPAEGRHAAGRAGGRLQPRSQRSRPREACRVAV